MTQVEGIKELIACTQKQIDELYCRLDYSCVKVQDLQTKIGKALRYCKYDTASHLLNEMTNLVTLMHIYQKDIAEQEKQLEKYKQSM